MSTLIGLHTRRLLCLLFVAVAVGLFTGCRYPWEPKTLVVDPLPPPEIMDLYRQAVESYEAREYGAAADRFQEIRSKTVDPGMGRKALYGLACARLMTAHSPEDYQEAYNLWQAWIKQAPRHWEFENPIFFEPLMREKMVIFDGDVDSATTVAEGRNSATDPLPWLKRSEELQKLRLQLSAAEENAQSYKKKITSLEKEIDKLQRQIKALETIDQKIQKKKSAIPSAD